MPEKIKLGIRLAFWTICPVIIGIFLASSILPFFKPVELKIAPQVAYVNTVIEEKPKIKDPDFLTFAFVGDIMLDRGVKKSVIKNYDMNYEKLFENMEMLKDFDITFANLEGPVSDKGKDKHNLYSFRMDPVVLEALKNAGIDIVSVANNHVGDWGRNAYVDSLMRLKENGIYYTGGGMDGFEAEQPTIIEKYGIKIGFLGFSDVGPNDTEVGIEKPGLLLARNKRFDEIISKASAKVDYLIVSFHFGDEYKPKQMRDKNI